MVWDGKMHQSSSTDKWGLPVKPSDNLNNTSTHLGPPPPLPPRSLPAAPNLHLCSPMTPTHPCHPAPTLSPTVPMDIDATQRTYPTPKKGCYHCGDPNHLVWAQWVKISINSQDLYLCTCRSADPYYCLINRSPQEVLRKIGSAIAQCNEAPHSSKEISSPVFASVANESYIALNFIAVRNSGTNISRVFRMKVVSLSIMYVRERKKLCTRDDNYPMPFLLLLNATPGAEESILSDLLPSMLKSSPFLKWPGQVSFCRHSCR